MKIVGALMRHRALLPSTRSSLKRPGIAYLSDWNARGHDITYDSLTHGDRPKVILQGYAPSGFDVLNIITKVDPDEPAESGTLHMNGSILAFPYGCFLWKVSDVQDITLESLAPVLLHRPTLDYLFIGANSGDLPVGEMIRIRKALLSQNTVIEKTDLSNAMGTFNILNAEDRQVAVALVIDPRENEESP